MNYENVLAKRLADYMEECGFAVYQKQKRLIEDFVAAQLRLHLTALRRGLVASVFVNVVLLAIVLYAIGGR